MANDSEPISGNSGQSLEFNMSWSHIIIGLFGLLLVGGSLITTAFLTSLVGSITSLHGEVAELRAADAAQMSNVSALSTKLQKIEAGYAGLSSDLSVIQTQEIAVQKGLDALSRVTADVEALRIRTAAAEKVLQVRSAVVTDVTRLKEMMDADQRVLDNLRQANIQIQSQLAAALPELESQFCSVDLVRNLMHASDLRTMAVLWEKVFDRQLPVSNTFYPQICTTSASSLTAHAASPNTAVPK